MARTCTHTTRLISMSAGQSLETRLGEVCVCVHGKWEGDWAIGAVVPYKVENKVDDYGITH